MMASTRQRALLRLLLLVSAPVLAAGPKVYPDPTSATDALVAAARSGETKPVLVVLGDRAKDFLVSGDPVSDRAALARFVELYDRSHELLSPDESTRTLAVGDDAWPFPIPLVKGKTGWTFDTGAGEQEILSRRVGQNELDVIQVCIGYVEAQRDYLARNPGAASVPHYADRLLSSSGKRDGLYWKSAPGEPESPMGPAVSGAIGKGYTLKRGAGAPYHGYHFRLLTAQGPHAEGGELDYREGGTLTRGFALVAWPASYGKTGIVTFLVNQSGVVLEKDLGQSTARIASGMKRYDPDASWKPVAP
ncbi:MAG: DUF2950 domain-containing protein [Myxococcaceae bacterium]|nr:MAG: DUF2950 domain-containing protein [Myxococcaceae bacterium]